MPGLLSRVAAAPVSWGVCEAPDWGYELDAPTVLSEIRSLDLHAIELGPAGYLGQDPGHVRNLLDRHGLRLVGGFVPVPLHGAPHVDLSVAEAAVRPLAECSAEVAVLAARSLDGSYDHKVVLSEAEWGHLAANLKRLGDFVTEQGLQPALHAHAGTAIEDRAAVYRLLETTEIPLCLDTGHLAIGRTDPLELVELAAQRIAHVHLKDVNLDVAAELAAGSVTYIEAVRKGLYRPLGEGDLDIAGLVRRLEQVGYGGWYVLEQDAALDERPVPGSGPINEVARSVNFLVSLNLPQLADKQ